MTVKKFDQHKLQQCVDVLDAFARSGLSAQAFANRGATRLKVLVYDGAGLWLCTRRLQQGRFVWPHGEVGTVALTITPAQWDWLIAGAPWQHLSAQRNITVV